MKTRQKRASSQWTSLVLAVVTLGTFAALREGPAGVVERFHQALSQPQIRRSDVQDCVLQELNDPNVARLVDGVIPRLRSRVPYRVVQTTSIQNFYLVDVTYEARPGFAARDNSWVVVPTTEGPRIDALSTLAVLMRPIQPADSSFVR